jgi:thioredoxin 1
MNREISKEEFKKEVISNETLSLVQFKTEWSGACQIISPIYEDLAKSYKGQVNFFSIDVEKEAGIDNEYGVTELPTILFFRKGEVIDHVTGLIPKITMITKIENALSSVVNQTGYTSF